MGKTTADRKSKKLSSAEKKKLGDRASRIRAKIRKGKTPSDEDKAFLASWDERKSARGAKPKEAPPVEKVEKVEESAVPKEKPAAPSEPPKETIVDAIKEALPTRTAESTEIKPPPDPIPKEAARSSKDWQSKYRYGETREESCCFVARSWANGLKRLNKQTRELGATAACPDEVIDGILFPAMVLTVDKYMPEGMEVDPRVTAIAGTSFVVGNRFMAARKAAKEEDVVADESFVAEPKKVSEPPEPPKKEEKQPDIGPKKRPKIPVDEQVDETEVKYL